MLLTGQKYAHQVVANLLKTRIVNPSGHEIIPRYCPFCHAQLVSGDFYVNMWPRNELTGCCPHRTKVMFKWCQVKSMCPRDD